MDNQAYPPPYRSRRRRDWRGWIIACAAIVLLFAAMALAYDAESAMLPPRPGTEKVLPAPVGRHERLLYCRNFAYRPAADSYCRQAGGYR